MLAQAGAVNEQGSCARGEGSVKAAALAAKAECRYGSGGSATAGTLMVLMRRAGTDGSVLPNTNPGNGSGWRRRLESSEQGRRQ